MDQTPNGKNQSNDKNINYQMTIIFETNGLQNYKLHIRHFYQAKYLSWICMAIMINQDVQ